MRTSQIPVDSRAALRTSPRTLTISQEQITLPRELSGKVSNSKKLATLSNFCQEEAAAQSFVMNHLWGLKKTCQAISFLKALWNQTA